MIKIQNIYLKIQKDSKNPNGTVFLGSVVKAITIENRLGDCLHSVGDSSIHQKIHTLMSCWWDPFEEEFGTNAISGDCTIRTSATMGIPRISADFSYVDINRNALEAFGVDDNIRIQRSNIYLEWKRRNPEVSTEADIQTHTSVKMVQPQALITENDDLDVFQYAQKLLDRKIPAVTVINRLKLTGKYEEFCTKANIFQNNPQNISAQLKKVCSLAIGCHTNGLPII